MVNKREGGTGKGIIDSKGKYGIPGTEITNYLGAVFPASTLH
jgi:hypothetical protein